MRRLPFQQKIGAGLTTEQFQKKVHDGSVRHVGLDRVDRDDRRRARLDARSDHRRHPAEAGDGDDRRASSSPSIPATSAASSRTASATGRASRRSASTSRPISARRRRTTRSRSTARRGSSMKIAGGIHGDIATASIVVNSIPQGARRRARVCTRCATCRCRRSSRAGR